MHTYRPRDNGEYEVGFYVQAPRIGGFESGGQWVMLSEHKSERQAIGRVNALNGGTGQPYLYQ